MRVHETHSGVVVLYGDRAYKTKKPIVTDFLDFSTADRRERACRRELELNRRLAPDVYVGIAHLSDPAGRPSEPILVMRRMPEDRRLSAMLDAGTLTDVELRTLARTLADFHRTALRGDAIDQQGTAAAVRRRWRVLLHSLAEQPPGAIDPDRLLRADRLAMRFLDGRDRLFTARIHAGRIVDGHGDLLAEDIFALPDGLRILDCLDFDDTLRSVDVLDDAAFLAMDLEFLGRADLAAGFLDAYLEVARDEPPDSLRHHYIAYRSLVRAKTDRIRAAQGDPDAAEHARRHLDLTVAHLERGAVRLALVGGLPGTGKSTVATRLAAATGARVISSDTVRAELRAAGTITGQGGHYGTGAYRPAARALVYDQLLERARTELELGRSVILDAS
ncbi:AAA family ATPase [Nocardia sp. CDC153]|uniref:bifunctional aminoglycoside phosphotransferase/ATP-binding protein n=1 Tax=Nocardia sp. CDC153 TaxID=3112167 RepID=UPI002DBA1B96|nr:AAA family ATPase [Nocardia sp. CDC153]MEC3957913.1 AAA family ATPase [Nocardia sp. CDC153]